MKKIFDGMKIEFGNTQFQISFAYIKKKEEPCVFLPSLLHNHPFFEAHIATSGSFCINADKKYEVHKDEILLLPPKFYHSTEYRDEEAMRYTVNLSLQKTKGKENTFAYFEKVFPKNDVIHLKKSGKLCKDLGKIFKILLLNKPVAFHRAKALFSLWIMDLSEKLRTSLHMEQTAPKYDGHGLEQEEELLLNLDALVSGLTKPVTLRQLAEELYLSKKQISALFKKRYNMSFKQKLSFTRIENIKAKLLQTDEPIKAVARSFGYTNLTSFYAVFKKTVGCTPAEYRKLFDLKEEACPAPTKSNT